MAPTAIGPSVWPTPNAIVIAAMPAGHSDGGQLKRTKAVVEPTTAKKATPNTKAEIASNSGEWPKIGRAAPSALTPRMMVMDSPPRSSAIGDIKGSSGGAGGIGRQ